MRKDTRMMLNRDTSQDGYHTNVTCLRKYRLRSPMIPAACLINRKRGQVLSVLSAETIGSGLGTHLILQQHD